MNFFSRNRRGTRNDRYSNNDRYDRDRHSAATDGTMTDNGYHNTTHHGVTDGVERNDYDRYDTKHSHKLGRRNRNRNYSRSRSRSLSRNRGRGGAAHREKRPLFDRNSGYYNRRPSFGTWLKYTWLDVLTMIVMGAIGLGVYMAPPAPSRSFPITFEDGTIVYPQFAYPLRKEIIPIWAAALLAALVPIFIFLVMQIRIRSFWDVNNAVIGLLYSLIGAAVFQVFVKWLIGGLRPHFLDVCQPDLTRVTIGGNGYRSIMFTPDICTGDRKQINDSLESMPSGHSTAAWAGFLYLYFYLNAKLKVFSNHHPAMWKLIALYAPVLGACLITGALTIDEFHNWYDCLAGAVIGSVFAISSYRMVYASVWDFRFNHIPLTRHTPFSYGAGSAGAGGFESCVFTHKAGWGYEEAYGGAPFDSAFALRGMGGGISGASHTVGLGHKHGMGHRDGDIEHNAVHSTGTHGLGHHTGTGIGHTTTGTGLTGTNHTTGTGLTGTHHNTGTGIGHHNHTTGTGLTGTHHTGTGLTGSHHTGTTGTAVGTGIGTGVGTGLAHHNNHNQTHGTGLLGHLGHHNNNTTNTTSSITHPGQTHTHDSVLGTRDNDYGREGRSTIVDDNRYRSHRKSLERKALANQNQGALNAPGY